MASSGRVRQSNAASRPNRGPTPLPPYQPPANKLNNAGQRALHSLPNNHRLDGLQKRLKHANTVLSNTAGELNDRYQQKATAHQRRQARRRAQGAENDEDDEDVEKMQDEVEGMTNRMEQSVRMIVDASAAVEGVETALRELDTNISAGGGAVAPTQSTLGASQFKQKKRKPADEPDDNEDEDGDEDEDEQSEGEAAPSQVLGDGLAVLWKKRIAENQFTYEEISMHDRYAANNDYVGFRKIIHDARHPGEDAPPMPHASTWFLESQETLGAGNDGAGGQAAAGVDDDEEVAIASEKKSVKCPITLQTMVEPLSSIKCPHSFEGFAILDMLRLSEVRIGGSGRRGVRDGEQAIKCPECNVMLTASDLQPDPVLIRRIKRLQAAEAMQDADSDDEGESPPLPHRTQKRQAEPISSDAEGEDTGRARSVKPKVKAEKLASSARNREVSMVPNSQVRDISRQGERPPSTAASEIVDLEDSYTEDGEE